MAYKKRKITDNITCQRSYKLKMVPTESKSEIAKYALNRANLYLKSFLGYELFDGRKISTKNQGQLANQMACQAKGKAKAIKESSKETGNKWNVPQNPKAEIPCKLEKSKNSFDYWITVSNLWEKAKTVKIPLKSHKALNKALKNNWKISKWAYLKDDYVIVFVSREVDRAKVIPKCLGIDVGMKRAISTSDGFCGKSLSPIMKKNKKSGAERYRQRMKFNQIQKKKINKRTNIKQELNIYAKALINRAKKSSVSLALESPVVLNNLKSGKLQGWARNHLFNRVAVLGKEEGIFVIGVNPYNTSRLCHCCQTLGEREKILFTCGNEKCKKFSILQNADTNASINIETRGTQIAGKILLNQAAKMALVRA